MFFDEYKNFEITEILKIKRSRESHTTKKRGIGSLSCRIDGKSVFYCNGKETAAEPGQLLFIPQGTEYSQKTDGEELVAVHLKLFDKSHDEPEIFLPKDTYAYSENFKNLYNEWNLKKPGYKQRCTSMLYRVLADVACEKHMAGNGILSKISNAVTFLDKNFSKPNISIGLAAKQSNISEIYFRKLWNRLYDETPAQYLNRLRIDYAKSLLVGTDYTVAEIAEYSGFGDAKYFSVKFKKQVGISPLEYRGKVF